MGLIGRFIDDACASHPDLMARVLDREFATLEKWIDFDEEGEACGCLIGTIALVAGIGVYDRLRLRLRQTSAPDGEIAIRTLRRVFRPGDAAAAHNLRKVGYQVHYVSVRVHEQLRRRRYGRWATREEAEAKTVDFIKRRIARALARQAAPAETQPAEVPA